MISAPRKILMACLHYWGSPFQVATHHLARRFVESGWDVLYLSAPITPLHLFRKSWTDLRHRFELYANQSRPIETDGLRTIVPGCWLAPDNRPLLRNEWITRNWPRMTVPKIEATLARVGFSRPDVLYLDNFYHAGLLDVVSPGLSCYHMADDYSGFPGYGEGFRRVERDLCKRVDLVACPSIAIHAVAKIFGASELLFLPNGVDSVRFANAKLAIPDLYEKLNGPIAVYVGAMDAWFDQHLVIACAKALPQVNFVLLGPSGLLSASLLSINNIHAPGMVGRTELPGYLIHAQVGLIPFNTVSYAKLLAPVRPLKMLEYLAAGLPVVSSSWTELEGMRAPISLADDAVGFVTAIQSALSNPPDKLTLQAYAKQFEWSNIFLEFESALLQRIAATQ